MALVVGGLLVAWSLVRMSGDLGGGTVPVGLRMTAPWLLCLTLLLAWLIVQNLPGMPAPWRHPIWQAAVGVLGRPDIGSIGLDPGNAVGALIRLGTYGGIFWLALQYGRDSVRAEQAIAVVAVTGVLCASYGLGTYFLGSKTILWFDKEAYGDDLTGTFVNRNTFATYAGLGWLCLLALFFRCLAKWTAAQSSLAQWFRAVFKFVERQGWLYLLGTLLLASAVLTSHSRGGLVSCVFGIVIFCLSLFANASHGRNTARRFSWFALVLLSICCFAGGRVIDERLTGANTTMDDRIRVYSLTVEAIGNRPWLGTGLGTFEEAFRSYRTPEIKVTFAQAHNTYLETGLEMGILGGALVLAGLLGISLLNLWGVLRRRRHAIYPCLGLGATALVAAHAMVDFSIQIPAVAATYAMILGVSFAQSWSSGAKTVW